MDVIEVGITAHGEGAQQVQRRGRLAVGHHLPLGIGNAGFFRKFDAVDDIAAVARQRDIAELLDVGGARLGELAGDTADLDHRLLGAKRQDNGHLQEGAEEVADVVGAVFGKALGTITALQQEAAAFGDIGERLRQTAGFTGENQRRIGCKLRFRRAQRRLVRIVRHLLDGFLPPAARGPILYHLLTCAQASSADAPSCWKCGLINFNKAFA